MKKKFPVDINDYLVSFDKTITFEDIASYPDLDAIATRWISKNLANNYLRFNSKYSEDEVLNKLASALSISVEQINIIPTLF